MRLIRLEQLGNDCHYWRRALLLCPASGASVRAADVPGVAEFHDSMGPILQNYCFDCHGDGDGKGKAAFDPFKSE